MNHLLPPRRFSRTALGLLAASLTGLGAVASSAQGPAVSTPASTPTTRPLVNRAPFGGKVATIPGKIEAENFDEGPQGVAYHDRTPDRNEGAGYRPGVGADMKGMIDVPGRKAWYRSMEGTPTIGWFFIDEWLTYSVDVTAGTYDLRIKYATPIEGKVMNLTLGDTVVASVPTPLTGGYEKYKIVTFPGVKIDASGRHVLKVQPAGNPKEETDLDWVEFLPAGAVSVDSAPKP